MKIPRSQSGQSFLETVLCLGLIVIPLGSGIFIWANLEFKKNEAAFLGFQKARIQMIRTHQAADAGEVHLQPLERLDQVKKGLLSPSELKQVLQLWDFRFWFSRSSLPSPDGSFQKK